MQFGTSGKIINPHIFYEGDGGAGGGAGGDGGGEPAKTDPPKTDDKTLTQADVDRIVQDRVGQTKRQTEEAIAKQLGVPVEDAKRIIEEHQKQSDKDKSDAQLAREQADREKQASEAEKSAAAKERHDAAVDLSGLTPGWTTFTAKYRVNGGTGTWDGRTLEAIPIP